MISTGRGRNDASTSRFVASGQPCAAARDAEKRLGLRNGGELPKKRKGEVSFDPG